MSVVVRWGVDVATVGALTKYTGRQLYYYGARPCAASIDRNVERCLTCHTGWESVMQIHCSKGVRIGLFHGNFLIRSSDVLAILIMDENRTYAVQLEHNKNDGEVVNIFFLPVSAPLYEWEQQALQLLAIAFCTHCLRSRRNVR